MTALAVIIVHDKPASEPVFELKDPETIELNAHHPYVHGLLGDQVDGYPGLGASGATYLLAGLLVACAINGCEALARLRISRLHELALRIQLSLQSGMTPAQTN